MKGYDCMKKTAGASGQPEGLDSRNQVITEQTEKRKRGRPKGTKDKMQRKKRTDNSIQRILPDDTKQLVLKHNLELFNLPPIKDKNDIAEFENRIKEYFTLCVNNNVLPTVAGLATAFKIDRVNLWRWIDTENSPIKNVNIRNTLKEAYNFINAQYEDLLTMGKIVPVSAFFLMQNNYGYKQQTDHVITASTEDKPTTQDIVDRAGLLTDE